MQLEMNWVSDQSPFEPAQQRPLGTCDRSPSEPAYVRVELDHGELEFCAHHYREFKPSLDAQGAQLIVRSDVVPS